MFKVYLLIFGAAALYIGLTGVRQHFRDKKREYRLVYGKIIDQQRETRTSRGKSFVSFSPVFQYNFNGQTYQGNHIFSSAKYGKGLELSPASKYEIGTEVELRVFLDDPSQAVINTEGSVKFPLTAGVAATCIGIVLIGVAIALFLGWTEISAE